ncbi:MAG: hypothetical protein ACI97N_002200, partial [Cognaticolwellia sp.]
NRWIMIQEGDNHRTMNFSRFKIWLYLLYFDVKEIKMSFV